ncbi:transmembrane protein 19-like [Mya arenaria]|uniref:transmembrane protein 19-like n=1 Tax=Mya arenaria TaxID=6604 RepID=UPI0022E38734|nr:transmembrane protein 19-like [Mya arenaria]
MISVYVLLVLIPLSLLSWKCSYFMTFYNHNAEPISPVRFLIALVVPILISQWSLRRQSLDISGAVAACVVGFIMTISNLGFFSALLSFFIAGSKVTKFRAQQKKSIEEDFKEGGQRNWIQVFCNGGIAAQLAFLYLLEVGCTEKLIDFERYYIASWLSIAVMGSLCCSCGDTFSSEIGSVFGKSKTAWLITTFQSVPKGTNGGISVIGTLASFVGGAVVSVAFYLTLVLVANEDYLTSSPPQWPLIFVGGMCGLLGSIIDSFLGATLQYSGYDKSSGRIVNKPGPSVEHICGTVFLDNHSVNLVASLSTALLAPRIAFMVWTHFT